MDWPQLMEAAGRMGMSEQEFELTTPRYFFHRQRGYESAHLDEWKRMRMHLYYSILPHVKKNSIRRPQDLFMLTDEEFRMDEQTRQTLSDMLRKVKNIDLFAGETIPKGEA